MPTRNHRASHRRSLALLCASLLTLLACPAQDTTTLPASSSGEAPPMTGGFSDEEAPAAPRRGTVRVS